MRAIKGIDIVESEYATLFRLQREFSEKYPQRWGAARNPAYQADFAALVDQSRAILGAERSPAFLKGIDPTYSAIDQFANQHAQSLTNAQRYQLYELQREVLKLSVTRGTPGSRLSGNDYAAAVRELASRAESVVGAEIMAAYKKQTYGRMFYVAPAGP